MPCSGSTSRSGAPIDPSRGRLGTARPRTGELPGRDHQPAAGGAVFLLWLDRELAVRKHYPELILAVLALDRQLGIEPQPGEPFDPERSMRIDELVVQLELLESELDGTDE